MEVIIKRLSDLQPMQGNLKRHREKEIVEYIRSIEICGQLRPLVIDEDNVVLAGERILAALQSLGRTTAACRVVKGLSADEKKRLRLLDEEIFNLTDNNLLVDVCTCPHCGFKFERGITICQEKQNAPAATKVAHA